MMRLAAFGDSITSGDHLAGRLADAWPAIVGRKCGLAVDNRGVGGSLLHDPSATGRPLVSAAVAQAIAAWAAPPQVAVVLAGHNDVIEHSDAYSYPSDLRAVDHTRWAAIDVDQALAAAGVPIVLWVTLCPRTPGTLSAEHPDYPQIWQGRINAHNAWLVAQWGPRVVDTRGRFGDVSGGLGSPVLYVGDGLHPSQLGHEVIAERVAAALIARGLG